MRILSQDGWDFPYDSIIVFAEGKNVCAKMVSNPNFSYIIGRYTRNLRAQYVVDEIREFYLVKAPDQTAVFNMPEE